MAEDRAQTASSSTAGGLSFGGKAGAIVLSGFFVIIHAFCSETYDGARLPELTSGVAHLPYQFRALVPWIIRGINRWYRLLFGDHSLVDSISGTLLGEMAGNQFDYCDPTLLLMYLLLEFGALLLLVSGGLKVLSQFSRDSNCTSRPNHTLFVLILFLELFWNYTLPFEQRWWYASDIVGLTFFTWGICRILEGRWLAYGLLFFAGAWNKETVLFLIPFFYLRAVRSYSEPLVALAALMQLVLWAGVKYALGVIYGQNRGFLFHPNIIENVELLFRFQSWLIIVSCGCGVLLMTFIMSARSKGAFMRVVLWTYILFFVGLLLGGRITELRAYGELLPLAAVVAVASRKGEDFVDEGVK